MGSALPCAAFARLLDVSLMIRVRSSHPFTLSTPSPLCPPSSLCLSGGTVFDLHETYKVAATYNFPETIFGFRENKAQPITVPVPLNRTCESIGPPVWLCGFVCVVVCDCV